MWSRQTAISIGAWAATWLVVLGCLVWWPGADLSASTKIAIGLAVPQFVLGLVSGRLEAIVAPLAICAVLAFLVQTLVGRSCDADGCSSGLSSLAGWFVLGAAIAAVFSTWFGTWIRSVAERSRVPNGRI